MQDEDQITSNNMDDDETEDNFGSQSTRDQGETGYEEDDDIDSEAV